MTKKKPRAAPTVLNPIRGCQFCGGTGWVRTLIAPPPMERTGAPPARYDPPSERCSCTKPMRRDEMAPAPLPAGIDQAQRAAGEREEA